MKPLCLLFHIAASPICEDVCYHGVSSIGLKVRFNSPIPSLSGDLFLRDKVEWEGESQHTIGNTKFRDN